MFSTLMTSYFFIWLLLMLHGDILVFMVETIYYVIRFLFITVFGYTFSICMHIYEYYYLRILCLSPTHKVLLPTHMRMLPTHNKNIYPHIFYDTCH